VAFLDQRFQEIEEGFLLRAFCIGKLRIGQAGVRANLAQT
jgi:hypothetical protein